MKTVQKIFTALFMIAPFYGAMAGYNITEIFSKYCDNEGYYTDDTFKTPSYAVFRDNCNAEEPSVIVSCYKWKNKDQDLSAITDELKHYCSTETENRVEVGEEERPETHVKKPSAAFTQSKEKLEKLFETAKTALNTLKEKEQKESEEEGEAQA